MLTLVTFLSDLVPHRDIDCQGSYGFYILMIRGDLEYISFKYSMDSMDMNPIDTKIQGMHESCA